MMIGLAVFGKGFFIRARGGNKAFPGFQRGKIFVFRAEWVAHADGKIAARFGASQDTQTAADGNDRTRLLSRKTVLQ